MKRVGKFHRKLYIPILVFALCVTLYKIGNEIPWKVHELEQRSRKVPVKSFHNLTNEIKNANISNLIMKRNSIYFWTKSDHNNEHKHEMPFVDSIKKLMEKLNELNMKNSSTFNYFYPYANPMQMYPVLKDENVTRILLVTYFRSGSSFLGELLQQNTRSFYSYEPLHYMSDGTRIPDEKVDEAIHLIDNIFHCNFTELYYYINWAKKSEHQFLFKWNRFLWGFCRIRPHLCFDASFIREVCIRSPIQVMKVNRIDMKHVSKLLNSTSYGSTLKIVYLVRDPRAIFTSRKSKNWCNVTSCSNITVLCKDMDDDLIVYQRLKQQFAQQIFLIRYEDLSMRAMNTTQVLFQKLNIKFTEKIKRYLFTHTNVPKSVHENANPYSTRRNSKLMPLQWTNLINFDENTELQSKCTFLSRLGYKTLDRPPIQITNLNNILGSIDL